MTSTPPPPPGGPAGQEPEDPYTPPTRHTEPPPQPPAAEGYPSQPAQGGTYEPPPGGGHNEPPSGTVYGGGADPYASDSAGQGGYQPQEPYTPPPNAAYPPAPPPAAPGGGGYPPGPPDGPYWPPEPQYSAPDPYDPIVATDFNTWMNRVSGVFKRSWKSIGLLMLIGAVLPGMVLGTVNTSVGSFSTGTMDNVAWGEVIGGGLWSLLAWVITGFLSAVAVVGSLRAAVREGTPGTEVPFGESFSYGLGRGVGMWGWGILASLVIAVGFCACVLPGVYLAIALAVLAPAFVFEGGNPFVRSFKLTHSDFGRALSRLLVAFLVALVYGCVIGIPVGLIEGALLRDGELGFGGFIVVLIVEAVRALLMLPLAIGGVAVVLVTYAELRARIEGLSTQQLVAEADAVANRLSVVRRSPRPGRGLLSLRGLNAYAASCCSPPEHPRKGVSPVSPRPASLALSGREC